MNTLSLFGRLKHGASVFALFLAAQVSALAQVGVGADPWSQAAFNLQTAFTGPIGYSLLVVAVVLVGIFLAYSQGQGKEKLGSLVFGGAMIIGAIQFVGWLWRA